MSRITLRATAFLQGALAHPAGITLFLVLAGGALWGLSYNELTASSDRASAVNALGASLLTGAVVSGAFVVLDRRQAHYNARQALLLRLGFTADLSGIDLRNAELNGIYLGGKIMRHANFEDAKLAGASFFGSDLTDAVFTRAILSDADFSGATLTRATFVGADITRTDFSGVKGRESAVFVGAITGPVDDDASDAVRGPRDRYGKDAL